MKYLILFSLVFLSTIFSCNQSIDKEKHIRTDNEKLYNLLFNNQKIKSNLTKLFDIEKSGSAKAFKIMISRRNSFVRITVYQIFSKIEINELPTDIISYNKNIFLYYNSSELIFENHLQKNELEKILSDSKVKFSESDSFIQDSRVLQFDLLPNKELRLNFPAISPFDEDDREIDFK